MPHIKIEPNDFAMALHVATDRMIESLHRDRKDILFDKPWDHAFLIHLYGAVGEIAFAKWAWTYPKFSVCQFSGMDSDLSINRRKVEVRHRTKPYYELNIRDKDPKDRIYVLTRGLPPDIDIVGWIIGEDVLSHPEWRKDHGGYGECWFVPDDCLRLMEDFKK